MLKQLPGDDTGHTSFPENILFFIVTKRLVGAFIHFMSLRTFRV